VRLALSIQTIARAENERMKTLSILFLVALVALVVLAGFVVYSDIKSGSVAGWGSVFARSCKAEAKKRGLRWAWRFELGCMIEDESGAWRPLNYYQEIGE